MIAGFSYLGTPLSVSLTDSYLLWITPISAAPTPTEPTPLVRLATEAKRAGPASTAKAVFPNGFKDVHAMNEAAEALHALTRGGEEAVEAKVRKGALRSGFCVYLNSRQPQWTRC